MTRLRLRNCGLNPRSPASWRRIDRVLRRTLPCNRYLALVADAQALNAAFPDGVPAEIFDATLRRAVSELRSARRGA